MESGKMKCPYCEINLELDDCFDEDWFDKDRKYEYWFGYCVQCEKGFKVRELWEKTSDEVLEEIED